MNASTSSANSLPQPRPNEKPLALKTRLKGPIESMSLLRKSLLFAELSMIAYNDDAEVREAVAEVGFDNIHFFDNDGSQAYEISNKDDCVITCRGTEPNEWNDIKADANAISVIAETAGRVHSGFKKEVDDLWPLMEEKLEGETRTLYFTGHSLGGAMATICAGRCHLSKIKAFPKELYTYGSPRVGNKRYVNYCQIDYKRWVNNNDIVTRVPPPWMGYRHTGQEIYIDSHGKVRQISGWRRTGDRFRGFFRGLLKFQIDHLSDHSIRRYIDYIANAVCNEEGISREELYAQGPQSDL